MNTVFLVGRLTKTPEIAVLTNGKSYARFTIAIPRRYKDESGHIPTDFLNCTIWGKRAEVFSQFFCKGTLVGLTGEIRTSRVVKEGHTQYYTDIVCSDFHFIEPKEVVRKRMEKLSEENLGEAGVSRNSRQGRYLFPSSGQTQPQYHVHAHSQFSAQNQVQSQVTFQEQSQVQNQLPVQEQPQSQVESQPPSSVQPQDGECRNADEEHFSSELKRNDEDGEVVQDLYPF
ncbi:MAG: single-stranded DNA-binding protein [Streptococcaceae bacterium]|nr:single-stranded DNA-binding protein [Streptococcaceae bacterium]